MAVPITPAKVAYPPPMLMPTTRPCLFACVPRATTTRWPDSRCTLSTQSPAAQTPSTRVRIRASTATPPDGPSGMPAATASAVSGRTPSPRTTRSAGSLRPVSVTTATARPCAPVSTEVTPSPSTSVMPMAVTASAMNAPMSGSKVPTGVRERSTTVTSSPRTWHASASSSPM